MTTTLSSMRVDARGTGSRADLTYLSLGAGVQSTALLVMSALGLRDCPRADVAVFADTGDEPEWVYEHLHKLKEWSTRHGVPVKKVSYGCISSATRNTQFATVPAFTRGEDGRHTPLRRQCTREFKIAPIEKYIRERLGYGRGQRVKHRVNALIGISINEASRIKPSRTPWVTNLWPLIDAAMDRRSCELLIARAGIEVPRKSSCVFCPYHSDDYWRDLKTNYPKEFGRAVTFDNMIRTMSGAGAERPLFVHRTL